MSNYSTADQMSLFAHGYVVLALQIVFLQIVVFDLGYIERIKFQARFSSSVSLDIFSHLFSHLAFSFLWFLSISNGRWSISFRFGFFDDTYCSHMTQTHLTSYECEEICCGLENIMFFWRDKLYEQGAEGSSAFFSQSPAWGPSGPRQWVQQVGNLPKRRRPHPFTCQIPSTPQGLWSGSLHRFITPGWFDKQPP